MTWLRRYAWGMPRREDDDVARRPVAVNPRTLIAAGGFVLAVLATLAVFLTDNPQYLRVAVVAVAWAFVLATFAAGRRGTDRVAAAAREAELRHAYEQELDREVAARREYELELESELRRETEEAMRFEIDALRADIAAQSREEVALVSELRSELLALSALRDDVAQVAALRDDVAALNSLRQELGQLAELRADMGRLRAELAEQLSSEMLVERIVMRTQASRLPPGEPARLDTGTWSEETPPRELTGGWPAVRLDEPLGGRPERQPETASWAAPTWESSTHETPVATPSTYARPEVPSSAGEWWSARPAGPKPDADATPVWRSVGEHLAPPATTAHPIAPSSIARPPEPPPPPATTSFPIAPSSIAHPPVTEPPPSPLDWLAARSLLDEPQPRTSMPAVPPRRRSTDLPPAPEPGPDAPTEQRTVVRPDGPAVRIDDRGGYRVAVPSTPSSPQARPEPPTEGTRVAEILAENGVAPPSGGRRRRRYRDDDQPDDVLARVLGRN